VLNIGISAGVLFITILAFVAGAQTAEEYNQKQAIQRGYALYCPDDGAFAWIGECENE
jgi:hypothetical protein